MAKKTTSKKKVEGAKGRAGKAVSRRPAPKPRSVAAKPTPATKKKAAAKKPEARAPRVAAPAATPRAAEPKRSTRRATESRAAAEKPDREARRARSRAMRRFRQVLLDKYNGLVRAYNSAKGDTRRVTTDGTEDYIDYAVSSYDRDFSLSLSEMERSQIRMIEDALRRIDRGEYGDCLQCGEPIPEKRLEVEPWARHCVRCQALEEQGLLQARPYDGEYEEGEEVGEEEFVEVEADDDEEFETADAGEETPGEPELPDDDEDDDPDA